MLLRPQQNYTPASTLRPCCEGHDFQALYNIPDESLSVSALWEASIDDTTLTACGAALRGDGVGAADFF